MMSLRTRFDDCPEVREQTKKRRHIAAAAPLLVNAT